jgi:DNA replication protein DnaC
MKAKASYEDLLVTLFRAQYQDQIERSIQSRIRHARVPEKWSLATFPFDRQPGVEARVIRQLGTLDFVGRAENLVLVGPPGVGKTGIATGLLLRALESGYRGRFLRAQDLFDELYASLADRSTRKLLNTLARVDVLLVDEMGYLNLRPEQSNAFFKLKSAMSANTPRSLQPTCPTMPGTNSWATRRWSKRSSIVFASAATPSPSTAPRCARLR